MATTNPQSTILSFTHRRGIDLGTSTVHRKKDLVRKLINFLNGVLAGAIAADDILVMANATGALAPAVAVWVGATLSGVIGVTLGGVAITVASGGGDQASTDALLALVNSSVNALVQNLMAAGKAAKATITLATVTAGQSISIMGYRFTATAAATGFIGQFDISGNDTADAAALAAAINAMPGLNQRWYAYNAAGVVNLFPLYTGTSPTGDVIVDFPSTFTVVQLAATPSFAIYSLNGGAMANHVTAAASGTGASLVNAVARLVGGVGGNVTRIRDAFGGSPVSP